MEMIKDEILKILKAALEKIGASNVNIDLERPANPSFGDYSSSIALKLSRQLKKNPMVIAKELQKNLPKGEFAEKTEVVPPGFLNFWISPKYLWDKLKNVTKGKFDFSSYNLGDNHKVMVEFAHPNTHKLFHIGHLRNISTGESMVRILEAVGNKVIRSNYQGDVGLHIAKCLYGVKKSGTDLKSFKSLKEQTAFIGKMYTVGTAAYEENEKAKGEILKINKMIYDRDPEVLPLWELTRQWSLDYFDHTYQRVYSHFDRLYFESEFYKRGMDICKGALEAGILENSQGAVVFNGKKYGLDTRVFINSLGFPTYEGKELALAEKEMSDFGELDKVIHVVTPEQTSFFKVTFKVEELLDEKKYKGKQYHLIYEWVKLKEGKMSSRVGNIIEADWLIDQIKEKIQEKFKCDTETAEVLAVASTKYSFLKSGTQTIVHFDIDESIAVDGNSAPYLIYTYVRCQSVLKKETEIKVGDFENLKIEAAELELLRKFNQFPEVVLKAAGTYSPNLIANYLYELSSLYNVFYQKSPILKARGGTKILRLAITQATANVIKKGLDLLGIKTVEKM